MKHREWRTVMFSLFVLAFSVLLLSGAPRLIAADAQEISPVCERVVPAYLCSSSSAQNLAELDADTSRRACAREEYAEIASSVASGMLNRLLIADANGNILAAVSYMRSVYQSFALGDGFV